MVAPITSHVKHSSRIELSLSALKGNINFIRKKIGTHPRISSVVKANAYGHGIREFVPMLEKCGVRHFSVASAFEAEEVYNSLTRADSQIMIMGILYTDDMDWIIAHEIEFFVFNLDRLPIAVEKAKAVGKPARIHLEVETGANRTGLSMKHLPEALSYLKKHRDHLIFEGLCTHFGGAESHANDFKIEQQHERYKKALAECKKRKYLPNTRHIACSAAALMRPETVYDMVRMGVSTYGFWPSPEVKYHHLQTVGKPKDSPLKRVLSWKTDIMDIRHVNAGEFIGYGTSYQATHDMEIAVIPLGYSNGYPRGSSNRGQVLIHGKKAPIVGLINMNLFMVDISHIPDASVGNEVVLVGRQKNAVLPISSFTESNQLMNNEMLSRLPAAIPRYEVK